MSADLANLDVGLQGRRERAEERRSEVRRLRRAGKTVAQVAETLGVARETVSRDLKALGMGTPVRRVSAEDWARAEALLDDGASYSEAARTIGVAVSTVRNRYPGRGMPAGWWWANELKAVTR
ncbi:helix-turn-helix DNA binding protein [Nocardia phage NS-I]|nr:helix-turn-helix DNA binding protein [Nocardia phage NS-I]